MVVVTLGGDTFSLFALGGGASWIILGVGAGNGCGCTMRNILAKRHSSEVCYVPIVLYGATGPGFSREWMISRSD